MQAFIQRNHEFVTDLLISIDHQGRVDSVHVALAWTYAGRRHPELVGQNVVAVAFDKFKGKWDFPGGKNECSAADPAVQVLTTLYKELYEELAVTITAPLSAFVLEILPCGKNNRNLLIVCGVKGIIADLFRDEMRRKHAIRPALPTCFLEMIDFKYLGEGDTATHTTGYVRSQHQRVLGVVRKYCTSGFPSFDAVMRIGKR